MSEIGLLNFTAENIKSVLSVEKDKSLFFNVEYHEIAWKIMEQNGQYVNNLIKLLKAPREKFIFRLHAKKRSYFLASIW